MKKLQLSVLLLLCYQIIWVTARSQYTKICVTNGFEQQCDQLERESQEVKCVRVQDSIECARILRNGSTGFGIFSAESLLLLAALKYDGLTVLKELRHRNRLNHTSDMDSVVIVRATHTGGIQGLKGLNYCHPGLYYDHADRWTERFLKHFERIVSTPDCEMASSSSLTPAEIEVASLAEFFEKACRPGAWSNNPEEDQKLKEKYPQLCELCTSTKNRCEYADTNRHIEALRCLTTKGQVAYVSLSEAQEFFASSPESADIRSQFAYLCPDNTLQLMTDNPNVKPCTWLSQPWPAIVSSVFNNIELSNNLNKWAYTSYGWENAIREILTADSLSPTATTIQEPRSVFRPYREVPFSLPLCSTSVSWCTKSLEEREKCEVIRMAGITTGVYPIIECKDPVNEGSIGCLKEVSQGKADFTVIDSNFGYIARRIYNLTTALYGETEKHASAGVVVRANSTFKSFEDLRGAKACFSEFNGIASLAFLNNGKKLGFLEKTCNHSQVLSDFFGPSCIPGATDSAHDIDDLRDNLCSMCPQTNSGGISAVPSVPLATNEQLPDYKPLDQEVHVAGTSLQNELDVLNSKINCNADQYNNYYGDQGALFCLLNKGDVAVLGLQDLNEHAKSLTIDPHYYQIICRNGTRADRTGFDVDDDCALAHYIDSEVVIKPDNAKRDGIINALLSFDMYFKSDPDVKIYGTFDGYKNVLFNNGTIGLAAYNENGLGSAVDNYNKLFEESKTCDGAFTAMPFATITIATMLFSITVNRLRQ